MQFRKLSWAGLIALAMVLAACGSSSSPSAQSTSAMSSTSSMAMTGMQNTARSGSFSGLNGKHVSGMITLAGGQITLADFVSDPGPDLHIYLANGNDEQAVMAGAALGSVAFDKASQTFPVNSADTAKYTTVVIHCDKAKAVFGFAPLA
jgi:electron transfer DM13